jgi:hypothetical protein
MNNNENLLTSELQVDATAHAYLYETAKWGNFLAILGFILSGLLAIIALFSGAILGNITSKYGGNPFMGAGVVMVIYLIIAGINFLIALYLYKFSNKMKTALISTEQEAFNESLLNLKKLYKTMGIIAIVYLGFLALAFILSLGSLAFS